MSRPPRTRPRMLEVAEVSAPCPSTRRVSLVGDDELADMPSRCAGAHIKVFIRQPEQPEPTLPTRGPKGLTWPEGLPRSTIRTYSVRSFEPASSSRRAQLDVEFVVHGQNKGGPAARWAMAAEPGDRVGIAGPGGPMPMLPESGSFVLAGDLSARPAISSILEDLEAERTGHVFIEVGHLHSIVDLAAPSDVQVHWLLRDSERSPLFDAVAKVLRAEHFAWFAGEHSSVVELRDFTRKKFAPERGRMYAVPYWKRNEDEEEYHQERHRVMDGKQ